jgi:cytochrome P450
MRALTTGIKRWLGRRALSKMQSSHVDLTKLPFVPDSIVMPLQRDGVDPVAGMAEIRAEAPMTRLAHLFGMNIWVVTGHDATRELLANSSDFSNDIRPLMGASQESTDRYIGGLGFTDPPDHTRLRKILTPEFTMRRLERLKPRIAEIVEGQLDELDANGPVVDLVQHFAAPIPFLVICELLGLPDEDRAAFQQSSTARFDVSQGGIGTMGAVSESREFLLEAVRRQRLDPGDGLIGKIIADHGDEIDDIDLGGLADGVFVGGFETSASMLALGSLVLLQHPEHLETLRHDDSVIDPTVEELLRYLSVVQISFPRFARDDLELFGEQVKAGDVIVAALPAANRDVETRHHTAGTDSSLEIFDPRRPTGPHYAFGHGFHRCIGADLYQIH